MQSLLIRDYRTTRQVPALLGTVRDHEPKFELTVAIAGGSSNAKRAAPLQLATPARSAAPTENRSTAATMGRCR